MGLYAKYVLPHVIDLAMQDKETTRIRSEVIPHAHGMVLELGIGSGLNLPFYSDRVRRVYGVDPSLELQKIARKRAATASVAVEFLSQAAEEPLPLDERSIDTVVITWTLCSIPEVSKALLQVKRVLKPTGQLIFVEHGLAPDLSVQTWQNRINPIWKPIAGGCNLNRKIDDLITSAGFEITELTMTYLPGPRPLTFTYQGIARQARGET
jgi:ubiquinone/menaquinone biosynthesis C-methylase UbiE